MDYPIGPDLCHCLAARRSARYLTRIYDRYLLPTGLSVSQFSILSLIEHHGKVRTADLAKLMVMERTTLVRALKPLQSAGWVKSEIPDGSAASEFSLSRQGVRKVAEARPLWEDAQRAFEAHFGQERAASLRRDTLEVGLLE